MAHRYQRRAGVEAREVGKHLFLVTGEPGEIHHMNQMGAGIWRLLAEPRTSAQLVEVLSAAFPATDISAVRRDVRNLLRDLEKAGVIERIDRRESTACAVPRPHRSHARA